MTLAIYPGSFDPITNGHIDVLKRASKLFDKVIIAVLINQSKTPFLPIETRIDLIIDAIKDIKNVEVDSFNGLTVKYAQSKNANALIRGLRAVSDFEHEMQMAQMNKNLCKDLETIFLVPKVKYNFLSSSVVREIALLGGDISNLVPQSVNDYFESMKK
ncbi:MAG: pantetheine-phosphate adenylyltransferase [Candidatus Gastranaerophilales bacterium]|nr:pantetheine-phosphate adenylyltransferase [Candidatus Gastranaerophilales bacterium]